MRKHLSIIALGAAVLVGAPAVAGAQDVKVVVNSSNSLSEISAADLGALFLKRVARFPGGGPATPVDQAKGSTLRATFSKNVLGRPVSAVDAYWQQQIFAGGELPPVAKSSDAEVVAFVAATPGAIGYVSAGASAAGVKVITVK